MSVAGISSAVPGGSAPPVQSVRQAEDQAARQLFQDLSSGNQAAAEQDFATLSSFGQSNYNSGPWTDAKMNAAFQTVGQEIQSGNLSGALSGMTQLGAKQVQYDQAVAQKEYQSGNMAAYQQAMSILQGDTWAVYGNQSSQPPAAAPPAGGTSGTGLNVQA